MADDIIRENEQDENGIMPGAVFAFYLLMEEKCEMPDRKTMSEIIAKHLGENECFTDKDEIVGFSLKNYLSVFEDASLPPNILISECMETGPDRQIMDEMESNQLWDCAEGKEILEKCRYYVVCTDMLAAGLKYTERAEMLAGFIEAAAEMFPSCRAVVCDGSKKMTLRENIVENTMPKNRRFIDYAVNVRYFTVKGTEDTIVDTLGMHTLYMPDLQYHFHGADPDGIVNHAYNVLAYMYDNDNPINPDDNIDGVADGQMSSDVQWKASYEDSLVPPLRLVIDFNMNEFASGERE